MRTLAAGFEKMYPLKVEGILADFRATYGVEVAQYRQDGGGVFVSEASGYWPLWFTPDYTDEMIRGEAAHKLGCKESDVLIKWEGGKPWARRWEK